MGVEVRWHFQQNHGVLSPQIGRPGAKFHCSWLISEETTNWQTLQERWFGGWKPSSLLGIWVWNLLLDPSILLEAPEAMPMSPSSSHIYTLSNSIDSLTLEGDASQAARFHGYWSFNWKLQSALGAKSSLHSALSWQPHQSRTVATAQVTASQLNSVITKLPTCLSLAAGPHLYFFCPHILESDLFAEVWYIPVPVTW